VSDSTPIAWRAIVYDTPVLSSDGARLGRVREVLGSDAEDIFHGIRVATDKRVGDDLVLTADHVTSITRDAIETDVARDDAGTLPRYDDEATYHLASVGWLRRHLGWRRDSGSDEEPG
jgi:uncharacterized protein YrrD